MNKQGILTAVFASIIFGVLKVMGLPVGTGLTGGIAGLLGALIAYLICLSDDEHDKNSNQEISQPPLKLTKQSDEKLYELADQELANSPNRITPFGAPKLRQGLLIKCMAKAEGNEAKGKAFYIQTRVDEMKADIREAEKKEAEKKEAEKKAEKEKEFQEGVISYPFGFVVFIIVIVCIVVIFGNA